MRAFLSGPPVVLPSLLDRASRDWTRLPPRVRLLVIIVIAAGIAVSVHVQIRSAESRWGGRPIEVWVATEDAGVGEVPRLRRARLPPRALPAAPVTTLGTPMPLTLALPAGAVLTERHVSPTGPAVGLPPGARLVPVPVEDGWGITAGARVDVWIRRQADPRAELVARGRPVIEVRSDPSGDLTALVSIAEGDVTNVTGGLGEGAVLLSHAPG